MAEIDGPEDQHYIASIDNNAVPPPGTACVRPSCDREPWARILVERHPRKRPLSFWMCFEDSQTLSEDLKSIVEFLEDTPASTVSPQKRQPQSLRQQATDIFGYHPPSSSSRSVHQTIRQDFIEFFLNINSRLPQSREKSLMITKLEEASMWAHKAVALQDPVEPPAPETML